MTQLFYKTVYGRDSEADYPIENFLSHDMALVVEKLQIYGELPIENILLPRESCGKCGANREPAVPIKDIEALRLWKILEVNSMKGHIIELTELGQDVLTNGFPEEKLWRLLPVNIQTVLLDPVDKTVAIGLLKKINAIRINDGIIEINDENVYTTHINTLKNDLRHKENNKLLLERKLLMLTEQNKRTVKLTDIGMKLYGNC